MNCSGKSNLWACTESAAWCWKSDKTLWSLHAQCRHVTRGRQGHVLPSRSPEKLQLLCEAGNQGCYALNGMMEGPADKTGNSGVQQTCAKSLKGCSWRKDKRCWQLGTRQKAELKQNLKKQRRAENMNLIRSLIKDCWM